MVGVFVRLFHFVPAIFLDANRSNNNNARRVTCKRVHLGMQTAYSMHCIHHISRRYTISATLQRIEHALQLKFKAERPYARERDANKNCNRNEQQQ